MQQTGAKRQGSSGSLGGPDVVVLSDLHLGEGLKEPPARYSVMEEFFCDRAFARLLEHLQQRYTGRPEQLELVLNGDVFDFLAVGRVPDEQEAERRGFDLAATELRFGLNPSEAKSVYKLDVIAAGHPEFFAALARFVGAGHTVRILRGNHDLELYFKAVRNRLRSHLSRTPGGPSETAARQRVRFHQWFYLQPGRLYIEHGNQYEPSNSIRYPLHPLIRWRNRPRKKHEDILDYPLGSLFVRYFYNRIRRVDPYTPNVVSFEQYMEFIRRYNLVTLGRIARDHYPFFVGALRPAAPAGRSRSSQAEDQQQDVEFQQVEAEKALPRGVHRLLHRLAAHPLAASKIALVQQMLRPVVKRLLLVSGLGLGSLYIWLLIFNLIQATPWLAENVFGKASLLAVFAVLTLAALFWLGNRLAARLRRQTDQTIDRCATAAERIVELTDVRLVLMGHTHTVDYRRIAGGRAVYANSGTWTHVDDPWRDLVPNSRRNTLLYVRGDEVQVCRWDDGAGRIEPVPFFATDRPPTREPVARTNPRLPIGGGPAP